MIEANDTINNTFDLRLADNMPYTIRNEQLIFIKEGFEHDLNHAILFDPKRKAVAYNTAKYTPLKMINHIETRNKDKFDFLFLRRYKTLTIVNQLVRFFYF